MDPNAIQSGENVGNLAVSYNEVDNTLTVTDGVVEYTYARDSEGDNGAIAGFKKRSSADSYNDYSLRGETSSGSGEAFLVNSTENGYEAAATFLNRLETTNLPTSGTASFSGDYSGVFYGNEDEKSVWYDNIAGDVTLDANFSNGMVYGSMTNRSGGYADQNDVALSVSSISNGAFSGTASGGGGGSPNGIYVVSDGTYEGMFTGADASEVIGSINIPMTNDRYSGFEMGIFIAEEEVTP